MKKTLLSCMTVCLALTAMQSHAQTQLKRSLLQTQLVSAAQLKADSIAMAVKGVPSDSKMSVAMPFSGNPNERTAINSTKPLKGISLAPQNDDFCIYATVMSDENWPLVSETNPETGETISYQMPAYDIYTFDGNSLTALGTDPEFGINNYLVANGGGTIAGSEYLFNYYQVFYGQLAYNFYFAYDLEKKNEDGTPAIGAVQHGDYYTNIANQVAYDATTGKVFGQFYNARRDGYVWGTRDIELGHTNPINDMEHIALRALAFDHLGRAWAIDTNNDLVLIDKSSGVTKRIGSTGLDNLTSNIMTGAIDPKTDTFYFFGQTQDGTPTGEYGEVLPTSTHLYTIDLKTGKATFVKDMPGNAMLAGAAFRPVSYAKSVPTASTKMAVNFDKDNLTGTLSFTAPSKTMGGQSISGTQLEVTLDGEVISTMSATAGQVVSLDVDVKENGLHVFQVVASTEEGQGKPATIQQWVGLDIPSAVTNINIVNTDYNHATITWDAPTEGVHHGYVDPAKLNYTIINSDGEVEATGLKANTLNVGKDGNLLSTRSYSITAFSNNDKGLTAQTDRIYYGNPFKAPCTFEFLSRDEFNLWSAYDANEDYTTWSYDFYGMFAECKYNRSADADDYLFSPPIHLTPTQYYNLTSEVASAMGYYQERYSIELASAPHPTKVIKIIHDETDTDHNGIQAQQFYKFTDPFRVDTEGDYYLVYHCVSKANQLGFQVHSVKIEKGSSDAAPAPATNTSIKPGESGALRATVTFTAPTTDTTGRTITELNKAELYHGDELAATLRNIEPGKTYEMTDSKFAVAGKNSYHLFIYNDEGKGLPVNFEVFVGSDIPGYCENADINVTQDGDVLISWEAPRVGKNGGYVNPNNMNYSVARQFDLVESYNGPETSFYDEGFPYYGEQLQVQYGIFPTNNTGEGPGTATPTIIGGEAYSMPFEETFGSTTSSTLWVAGYDPYSKATISVSQTPSYDNDGYCLAFANPSTGVHHKNVSSGRISVSTTGSPALIFAVRGNAEGDYVDVSLTTDGVIEHAKKVGTAKAPKSEWQLVALDLKPYAGKEVLFDFDAKVASKHAVYVDDVRVVDADIAGYENIAAGISAVSLNAATTATYYDLFGRRSNNTNGIVIIDGKKVIR